MTGSEKIDQVTALIESEIKKDKSPAKIADSVAQSVGASTRDLSTVFMFLTGQTLLQYIKERKIMASCGSIINSNKFDVQTAVTISGLGDQSALNKVFKKTFGYTPKEVFGRKDSTMIKLRMTWDQMGNTEITPVHESTETNALRKTKIFGIERSKYDQIKEIIELQIIYGFDELQSETAYAIHSNYDLPLKDTFQFVSEYHYNEGPTELDEEDFAIMSREEYFETFIKEDADDPEIRYIYFNGDMASIYTVFHVLEKLHNAGENDATQLDIDVINVCAYYDIDVGYCKKAIQYYKEHATDEYGDAAFDEYIEHILRDIPIEHAFSSIMQIGDWDDYTNDDTIDEKYDFDDTFEKWAAEETDYSEKYHIETYEEDDEQ